MGQIEPIIYIAISSACLFLSGYVYIHDRSAMVNKFFSLFLLSMVGWVATLYFFYHSSQGTVLVLGRLNFVFTELLAYFGFYFGYFFPRTWRPWRRSYHVVLFIWLVFLMMGTFFTDLIDKNEIIRGENDIVTEFGALYFLFILHVVVLLMAMILWPLFKLRGVQTGREPQQIKYFCLGTALLIIYGITTNIVLPFIFGFYDVQIFGPLGLIPFISFTAYAIIRHQLFDIRIVIQRGIIYSITLSAIIGFYITLICVFSLFAQWKMHDLSPIIAGLITTLVGLYTVPRIELYFRKKTDRIFFRDKYDYSEAVFALSRVMNKNMTLEKLLRESADKIKEIMRPEFVKIILPRQNLVFDGHNRLENAPGVISPGLVKVIEREGLPVLLSEGLPDMIARAEKADSVSSPRVSALKEADRLAKEYGIAISAAIMLEGKLTGLLVLGPKLSGEYYTREDMRLLETFSCQAAVAIEKARLYDEVAAHSRELEKKVEKRTARLRRLQEEQKQMMLEIAHGLQTPLTIIKGELGILKKETKIRTRIKPLEKTLDSTSRFIYDMLRLSRLESGGAPAEKRPVDLSAMLIEMTENFEIITHQKKIKIVKETEPGIILDGNEGELVELVNNLVSNSIKYADEKREQEIAIRLARRGSGAELTIADTGPGIAAEHLPRLFSRFYRIEDAEGGKKRGTGLGLAISKKIVERHGGTIRVESEVGRGTRFIIDFPIAK